MFEFQIASEKKHLFEREVFFLNRTYWKDAVTAAYGERENGIIPATLTITFPPVGEYRVVGYMNHKADELVVPLHIEQALDMDDHIRSRKCDLLGRKQARNETWILIDSDSQMLICGPAGAKAHGTERFYLESAAKWLRQLNNVVNRNWGASESKATSLTDYLAAVHALVRRDGFVPKAQGKIRLDVQPTYFQALMAVKNTPSVHPFDLEEQVLLDVTDGDRAVAAQVVDYVRSWDMNNPENYRGDFKPLIFKAAAENVVQQGIEAAAAWTVIEYLSSQSQYVGEVGTTLELHLRPIAMTELKKSYLHKMLTDDGNVLAWFSDRYSEWLMPGMYRVYIKNQSLYQGSKQTIVNVLDAYDTDQSKWTIEVMEAGDTWQWRIVDKNGRRVQRVLWF